MIDLNNREHLWKLRDEAQKLADEEGINPAWRRCYQRLADAVDVLDAFNGRSGDKFPSSFKDVSPNLKK